MGMERNSLIVRTVVEKAMPFILMYGLYVILHGEVSPGGGFQGGVVIGTAYILYTLVFGLEEGQHQAPPRYITLANTVGPLLFVTAGLWGVVTGYTFLANKVVNLTPHGELGTMFGSLSLLLINLGIGLAVSSVILGCFFAFLDRRPEGE
jgi:multicomponent Na+:H+ antiporter subunit B